MTSLLAHAGVRQRDAAHALATLLAVSHRPVTLMLRDVFGVTVRPVPAREGHRPLTPDEAALLHADPGTPCKWRTGRLETTSGHLAAGAFLLWVPGRLPEAACTALDAALEPAGLILSRLPGGMHREDLRAVATLVIDEITGEDASVRSKATLVTAGHAVGLAEENFMAAFVETLT